MARYEPGRPVYAIAERLVDAALRRDDSLFTPGTAIWALPWLDELDRRFVQNPEEGGATFDEKLRGQLDGASPQAYQLMGEALFAYYLPAGWNVAGSTKREKIQEVLSWSSSPVGIPDDLSAVLDHGIGSGGPGFHLYKPWSLRWLLTFVRRFKQESAERRGTLMADPWAFRDYAAQIPTEGGGVYGRESLLHMVFPDAFERIFSGGEKNRLATILGSLVDDPKADVDRRIASIRGHLVERFGAGFDFYDTDGVRALWRRFDDPWNGFIYWAARFHELPDFGRDERDYKIEIVQRITAAREAVAADGEWLAAIKRAFRYRNNLTPYQAHEKFLDWCEGETTAARSLLYDLWDGPGEPLVRMAAFMRGLPSRAVSGMGVRANLGSFLLMAIDPHAYPPYRVTAFRTAYRLTGHAPGPDDDEVGLYRAGLAFLDRLGEKASARGLLLTDRLDAQSAAWCVTQWRTPEDWPPEDVRALTAYRSRLPGEIEDDDESTEEADSVAAAEEPLPYVDRLAVLADELLIDREHLVEIETLLRAKGQVIFYGPPGTGKTYDARELARALAADASRVLTVQFHPSYAYEDFVEGFRPRLNVDTPTFELVPGPLKRLAKRAAADPGHDYFLIIDELNRGNVAKIFGELYYLLEYRDDPISLQYSAEAFKLPRNLFFIGTMNTADKSIALLDAALRRRFSFVAFFPDRPPIEGLLRRWLQRNRSDMVWVADVVDLANRKLDDRHCAIGPSFFMREHLDEELLERTWRREIVPYLEDYFFDSPDRLQEFALPVLKAELARNAVVPEPSPEAAALVVAPSPAPDTDGQADAS